MDFVSATRALGGNSFEILFKRILPNALTPLIVQGTLGIATAILDAAALSFLGLGAQPPTPEWGSMLGAERNQVFTAPHLVFYPGLAISSPFSPSISWATACEMPSILAWRIPAVEIHLPDKLEIFVVNNNQAPLLEVKDLRTYFRSEDGLVRAVDGVDFHVQPGEVIGLVGESGCGKSVTSLSIMRLISPPGYVETGEIFFEGRDLLKISEKKMRSIRATAFR